MATTVSRLWGQNGGVRGGTVVEDSTGGNAIQTGVKGIENLKLSIENYPTPSPSFVSSQTVC